MTTETTEVPSNTTTSNASTTGRPTTTESSETTSAAPIPLKVQVQLPQLSPLPRLQVQELLPQ